MVTYKSTNRLNLSLGNCRYYDYVVTRTRLILDPAGAPVFADPLAICCSVVTGDGKILIGRRVGVDGSIDKFHVVGGFIERIKDDHDGLPCPFKAIQREIYEEVGIEIGILDITCTGLIYDHNAPHPELCFFATTPLTYAEILTRKPVDLEVSRWLAIADDPVSLAAYIEANAAILAVPGIANLLFYGERKYGKKWREGITDL
jgi:8-oxo-dGTP pyrophosphatase MutT (NUDIX family)